MYCYQRQIYDVTISYHPFGRSTLINGLCPPDAGTVLEIGCRTGRNLVHAASLYPSATFFGFDGSTLILDAAAKTIARSEYGTRICIARADASTFSGNETFGRASFDRVYASYTLSKIRHWKFVVERALDHVGPRGAFHVIDFGPGTNMPASLRRGLHAVLHRFAVAPLISLREELSQAAAQRQMEFFHTELYHGYAQYAVLTRY